MQAELDKLYDHILTRVSINLHNSSLDIHPYLSNMRPRENYAEFYGFFGITARHSLHFRFKHSGIASSSFLGRCEVRTSILYKTDIRGDELKPKGTVVNVNDMPIKLQEDEQVVIRNSLLIKVLVHNHSHNLLNFEQFLIANTCALHYSNIHGSTVEGCFIAPFATLDFSTCRSSEFGLFSYVMVDELNHGQIPKGHVWLKKENSFEFRYIYPCSVLKKYIMFEAGEKPKGDFIDFISEYRKNFHAPYSSVDAAITHASKNGSVSRFAVLMGDCSLGRNILIAHRAYLENVAFGNGGNAQENSCIINSTLEKYCVIAHGGKLLYVYLEEHVFIGFNSFLRGSEDSPIQIGSSCIVMPHTIIDAEEPITIPSGYLVWGHITHQKDLETQTMSLEEFSKIKGKICLGALVFSGLGEEFINMFIIRIEHILDENGAYYDGTEKSRGHAQYTQDAQYNLLQAYQDGPFKGLLPSRTIDPLEKSFD